jgi:hypothetical protein
LPGEIALASMMWVREAARGETQDRKPRQVAVISDRYVEF